MESIGVTSTKEEAGVRRLEQGYIAAEQWQNRGNHTIGVLDCWEISGGTVINTWWDDNLMRCDTQDESNNLIYINCKLIVLILILIKLNKKTNHGI